MIAFPWLKFLPWALALLMTGIAAGAMHLYMGERDEFVTYKAIIKQAQDDQTKALQELYNQREATLKQVRLDYESKAPAVSDNAVRAYCLRNPAMCKPPADCKASDSKSLDDGAAKEPVALDRGFIAACGDDANKLGAWQDWCKRNNCTVEE